jgi:hypothetical protein
MNTVVGVLRRLPGWAWHAVVVEVAMYRNLGRWLLRRPAVPEGSEPVGYARSATPVMALWIFASVAELPLLHVLIPWHAVRLVALALGVWTVVWMLGALAGLRVYPHLLTGQGLRIRNGALTEVLVPWDAIRSARKVDLDLPSTIRTLQPEETPEGTHLRIGVSGRANVTVDLAAPLAVRPGGRRAPASTVVALSFWVDEPRDVVRLLRERAGVRSQA